MPVDFLSDLQRSQYGQYAYSPTQDELSRCFHLDDMDLDIIQKKRGEHNRISLCSSALYLEIYWNFFISAI